MITKSRASLYTVEVVYEYNKHTSENCHHIAVDHARYMTNILIYMII